MTECASCSVVMQASRRQVVACVIHELMSLCGLGPGILSDKGPALLQGPLNSDQLSVLSSEAP